MDTTTLKRGADTIKEYLKDIPDSCGVYQMIDKSGKVLYVGKAKNLKKRVVSYTRPQSLEYRIQSMIASVAKVEVITTKTESEALLLESNLVKKFEPKYNILLKDDKSYPYILIEKEHDFPRITKYRGNKKEKGSYFGPFASAGAVNKAITDLQKVFLLRPCSDSFFKNRSRPCMEYQIKRCSAPCVNKISKTDYGSLVKQAKDFLSGKSRDVQEQLIELMHQQSGKMNYEKAAVYRDRIKALNHIQAKQAVNIESLKEADIIGFAMDENSACLQVFFFRQGQNCGSKSYFPENVKGAQKEEILTSFIMQLYQNTPPPKEIILPFKIDDASSIKKALESGLSHKVNIIVPKLGEKKDVINQANDNAKLSLIQKSSKLVKQQKLLEDVAEVFAIGKKIKRIEVYDNSHISGTNQVGAMIVVTQDGFDKKLYRRFSIKNENASAGDDYAMMEEVLTRRFRRLKSQCPEYKSQIWPDLVLIDGGKGHMGIVKKVFDDLELADKVNFACISKGPERNAGREQFHMFGKKSFTLPYNAPVMHYLQVIRDEAHRFAIGGHRKKRIKDIKKSKIDVIPGIGQRRKKLLINHFGSVDGIKNAGIADLMKVQGISRQLAKSIKEFLK